MIVIMETDVGIVAVDEGIRGAGMRIEDAMTAGGALIMAEGRTGLENAMPTPVDPIMAGPVRRRKELTGLCLLDQLHSLHESVRNSPVLSWFIGQN